MTNYLLCNALLLAAYPLTLVWRLPPHTRLWLARISLLGCVAAPLVCRFGPSVSLPREVMARAASIDAISETVGLTPARIAATLAVSTPRPVDTDQVLLVLALAGVVGGLCRLGRDGVVIRRVLRCSVPFRRHGVVRVLVSGDVNIPFSFWSVMTKYIVLPVSMLDRPFDTRLAVGHEAQHHRQGDCLLIYPQEVIRLLFFLNPMIHLWLRRIGEFQELACDEALVRRRYTPQEYGACLVRVAKRAANPKLVCVIGMASRLFIQRRIAMLLSHRAVVVGKLWVSLTAFFVALVPTFSLAYAIGSESLPPVDRSRLETRLQRIAEEEARWALNKNQATSAAVIVVEPQTGGILAFAEVGNAGWETRAIPAGSVIKPLLFEAAMKAGRVTPDTVLDCQGPLTLDGQSLRDHESFQSLSATEALAKSSNIGAFRVSQHLGLSGISDALVAYGLPRESRSAGDSDAVRLAKLSVGESVTTTIATLARAYGKLASGGGDAIRRMLTHAVAEGTGRRAGIAGVSVAGKTGTVRIEKVGEGALGDTVLASFVGFVPSDAPRYVIYAVVENPQGPINTGGAVAAPVFQRVALRGLAPHGAPERSPPLGKGNVEH